MRRHMLRRRERNEESELEGSQEKGKQLEDKTGLPKRAKRKKTNTQ